MNKKEILRIDNQICFKLYSASRLMTQLYAPILEELDLTYSQYLVMLVLWEHKSLSVKEIGNILYLDSGTLTPLLKKLELKNIITRIRSKEDERVVKISLTEKAHKMYEKALDIPEKVLCKSKIKIDDILELRKILDKLINENLIQN